MQVDNDTISVHVDSVIQHQWNVNLRYAEGFRLEASLPEIDLALTPKNKTSRPQNIILAFDKEKLVWGFKNEEKFIANAFLESKESIRESYGTLLCFGDARNLAGIPGLDLTVVFYLDVPRSGPWLSFRVEIQNHSKQDVYDVCIDHFLLSRTKLFYPKVSKTTGPAVTVNGWQSWSYSGTLESNFTPTSWSDYFNGPSNESKCIEKSSRHYCPRYSDMFVGISSYDSSFWTATFGFLSQKQHFGMMTIPRMTDTEAEVLIHAPSDEVLLPSSKSLTTDPCTFFIRQALTSFYSPFSDYFDQVALVNHVKHREFKNIPVGWCSWYFFYENISEDTLLQNVKCLKDSFHRLPLSIVQVDDGFQKCVGDWTANSKFPSGLESLERKITEIFPECTPGIWLAPFISRTVAESFKANPHWGMYRKDDPKTLIHCGISWEMKSPVALDITRPDCKASIAAILGKFCKEFKFPYLKLDFLYGAAMKGIRYDPTVTRAQALVQGLELIRETVGEECFVLGCGCPIGTAVGYVDAMRISADVAPNYHPELAMLNWLAFGFSNDPHFPSMKNAVRNILVRSEMHKRFWINDPDCLLVRDTHSKLTIHEVLALATVIGFSGGMFFLSDDATKLNLTRRRIAESLFPVTGLSPLIGDMMTKPIPETLILKLRDHVLLGRCNWKDSPIIFNFEKPNLNELLELCPNFSEDDQEYHCFEFWTQTYSHLKVNREKRKLELKNEVISLVPAEFFSAGSGECSTRGYVIPVHGARIFALRKMTKQSLTYLGSNLHFSCGFELESIKQEEEEEKKLIFNFNLHCEAIDGKLYFYKANPDSNLKLLVSANGSSDSIELKMFSPHVGCIALDSLPPAFEVHVSE